jgi:hypothetical protein
VNGVVPHAIAPTARAVRWYPLPVVALVVAGLGLPAVVQDQPTNAVFPLASAALAAAVVTALDDRAAALLAAVPTPAMTRRLIRLGLLAVPALGLWWLLGLLLDPVAPGAADVAQMVALVTTGVAVAVWTPWARAELTGAAVPVAWFVADRVASPDSWAADLAGLWHTDSWPVCAAAVLLLAVGRNR